MWAHPVLKWGPWLDASCMDFKTTPFSDEHFWWKGDIDGEHLISWRQLHPPQTFYGVCQFSPMIYMISIDAFYLDRDFLLSESLFHAGSHRTSRPRSTHLVYNHSLFKQASKRWWAGGREWTATRRQGRFLGLEVEEVREEGIRTVPSSLMHRLDSMCQWQGVTAEDLIPLG
jgi:hypothetical protein